jgi:hypothetical protein
MPLRWTGTSDNLKRHELKQGMPSERQLLGAALARGHPTKQVQANAARIGSSGRRLARWAVRELGCLLPRKLLDCDHGSRDGHCLIGHAERPSARHTCTSRRRVTLPSRTSRASSGSRAFHLPVRRPVHSLGR